MLSDDDQRDLLRDVVSEVVDDAAKVEWLAPRRSWLAHARLRGETGLTGYVLTSHEWHEARFEEPPCSAFHIADREDIDYLRRTLERLTRVVAAYVSGAFEVEHRRGLLGSRPLLLVRTDDGLWRIGKRGSQVPPFRD